MYDLTPALGYLLRSQAKSGGVLTLELLEHAVNGTGAAAAAHGDVEFVVVFRHVVGFVRYVRDVRDV